MTWSAQQYLAFEDERTRPVRDLLAGLPPIEARTAIDIGCGPGNSTEVLAARFPKATVSGFDRSPDMIAAARKRLPGLRFEVLELQSWIAPASPGSSPPGDSIDVVLANAVLQWLPDHAAVFPALVAKLAPGGCLAVQVPDNLDEPAQKLMREVANENPWRAKLVGADRARVQIDSAEGYYRLLRARCRRVDVWRTTYYHPLADANAIVEWFKGTGLRPFLDPLGPPERAAYLARYAERLASLYPSQSGGVLLPFPRLFMVAQR
jgi:trans-aconitate 2-methyltransferase